jgi:hypothetical protein
MLPRIAVDRRVWLAPKCRLDLRLRRLGDELVLPGHMNRQRSIKPVDLARIFLGFRPGARQSRGPAAPIAIPYESDSQMLDDYTAAAVRIAGARAPAFLVDADLARLRRSSDGIRPRQMPLTAVA